VAARENAVGADQPRPGVPEHEYLRAGLPRPDDVCVLPEVGDGVDDNVRVGREEHAVDEDAAVDRRGHRLLQVREGGRGATTNTSRVASAR